MKGKLLITFLWIIAANLDAQKSSYIFSDSILTKYSKNNDNQSAAALLSFIGEHARAKEMFDKSKIYGSNFYPKTPTLYSPVSAIDFIREKAKTEQIIIINEAHHNAQHRVFTTKLLKTLYEKGFKYFSTETLNHSDIKRLNGDKYPIENTGYYTAEPNYGNLIREALNIGFEIFAYEDEIPPQGPEGIALREVAQAKNIKKILDKDPKAKIFIHCGFGHHNEMCLPDFKLMGCLLFEFSGVNPLTIDQTKDIETLHKETNHKITDNQKIKYSSVFVDSLNKTLSEKPLYDLSVFHPKDSYINERPIWLFDSIRKPYLINTKGIEFPCIVKAYLEIEYENSKKTKKPNPIPFDIIEMKSKEDIKTLSLKKGKYLVEIFSPKQNYQTRVILVE
jgi:hypothetical protein